MKKEDITILVVDDEPGIADLYRDMLTPDYEVWTANNGNQALDIISNEVDIVFLDRRMPGMSGDEVLRKIHNYGIDCQVAMLTAVEPDFDIIEMGFDDYLVKPVTKSQLYDTVENLMSRSDYEDHLQEYYALVSKQAVLEGKKSQEELESNEEYQHLKERIEELREKVDSELNDVTDDLDYETAFRDITKH
ncbi:MAG: HalX domain-containing protein [Halobacteria archaeon]|nr:HalX domain-containing protein [Halobacteria archaeon]